MNQKRLSTWKRSRWSEEAQPKQFCHEYGLGDYIPENESLAAIISSTNSKTLRNPLDQGHLHSHLLPHGDSREQWRPLQRSQTIGLTDEALQRQQITKVSSDIGNGMNLGAKCSQTPRSKSLKEKLTLSNIRETSHLPVSITPRVTKGIPMPMPLPPPK